MRVTALSIIEDAYEIALNPTLPYLVQLEPLGTNGELSNRNSLNKVLFKLCELVDSQGKEIKALKESASKPDVPTAPNPTQPLPNSAL